MRLLIFYFQILIPIPVFWWIYSLNSSILFFISIFLYVFVYRTIVDGYRLVSLGLIKETEIWKLAIPMFRAKYFKSLYFEF